jgi:RNA polymerase sigma-70 factor (ECF subfamily)
MNENLVAAVLAGKQGAFKTLVDSYQQMVLNVCYGFVQDYDDAQDLAQEVFIQVYHKLSSFREDAKLSTWIYRIAVNYSLNYIRSKKRRGFLSSLDEIFESGNEPDFEMESHSEQADKNLLAEEDKALLKKALDKLPKKQRAALTLSSLQDLSYKEVAEVMEIPVNHVGVLVNRGKKRLLAHLQKMM